MHLGLEDIADITGGELRGADVTITGAAIDSRSLDGCTLFVPIVAERDGHDFVRTAIDAGAEAYLTSRPVVEGCDHVPHVVVADTAEALEALGRAASQRIDGSIIGITGSVGKTTTKDLLHAATSASRRSHASSKSFNNELGVPLTLLRAPDDTEVAIVEMGARGAGHIARLCAIAHPDVGIVTCVGAAHTELFGDVDQVAVAKGELIEALPPTGTAVLNADDHRVMGMEARTDARVLTFGMDAGDVTAAQIRLDAELHPAFTLETPWGNAEVKLASAGRHSVANALAASAGALAVGVDLDAVAEGLGRAVISPWRMELSRTPGGATVINDAYNANPLSMHAALDALSSVTARRRIAVLGVMAELGDIHDAAHEEVGRRAAEAGILVVAVDVDQYGALVVADADAALVELERLGPLTADDAVLIKGSRVAGLETVAAALGSA